MAVIRRRRNDERTLVFQRQSSFPKFSAADSNRLDGRDERDPVTKDLQMAKRPNLEPPAEPSEMERELAAQLAQTMKSARFLVNKAMVPDSQVEIPNELLAHVPKRFDGPPVVVPTTLEEIEASTDLLLSGRQRQDFIDGIPVMVLPGRLDVLPKRDYGGQKIDEIQLRARDGFYVVVALATEQIRACLETKGRKYTTREGRDRARNELPRKLPFLPKNAFDEGQALLSKWCPHLSSHDILKNTYANVRQALSRNEYRGYVDLQKRKVSIASVVYARTVKALAAQHGMSALLREDQSISEEQLRDIVNSHDEYVPLDDLMLAAIQMDLNPSYAFRNHSHFEREFECGVLIGRLLRGVTVTMTPEDMSSLRRLFDLAAHHDADPLSTSEELRAAVLVRDHALNYDSMTKWQKLFRHVQALDQSIMLNPPPIA